MSRSPETSRAIFEDVKAVVVTTLDIEDKADDLGPETGLHGNLPELDSLTVVKLIVALQERFGIEIEIDEIMGDVFGSLGRLAAFVESKVRCEPLGGVSAGGVRHDVSRCPPEGDHRRQPGCGSRPPHPA